jgi:hypothetical protein
MAGGIFIVATGHVYPGVGDSGWGNNLCVAAIAFP